MPDNSSEQPLPSSDNKAIEEHVENVMGIKAAASPGPSLTVLPDSTNATENTAQKPDIPVPVPIPEVNTPNESDATVTPTSSASAPDINDLATDKAIEDIVNTEANEAADSEEDPAANRRLIAKIGRLFKNKWFWLNLVVILIAMMAVPETRYTLLGLAIKEPLDITVVDSKTGEPISGATIYLGSAHTTTNQLGKAILRAPLGQGILKVSKSYYKTYSDNRFVGFKPDKQLNLQLVATGRQTYLMVLNTITDKPLADAAVSLNNSSTKTNARGQASVVLPAVASPSIITVSLSGYNQAKISLVGGNSITHDVYLTPAGKIYFLSNASGTIDVMKSNLDGTDTQTVLAGTGKENPATTVLLASRDWRYLVLQSQRTGAPASLYLIDTSDDKVTEFDNSNATFNPIGWSGHDFIYDIIYNDVVDSQNGHEAIKSYDADTGQLDLLDQTEAEGTTTDYAYQTFHDFFLINNLVVYDTQWNTSNVVGDDVNLSSLSDTIRAVQTNGQDKKDYQTTPIADVSSIQAALSGSQTSVYAFNNPTSNTTTYYQFADGAVSTPSSLSPTLFAQSYPSYLYSPSGNQVLWSTLNNGTPLLLVGNQSGQSQKQIAGVNNYSPYGWYSNNYLVLSLNNEALYIVPATGLQAGQQALKINDYYQPSQIYNNMEYSYGGL